MPLFFARPRSLPTPKSSDGKPWRDGVSSLMKTRFGKGRTGPDIDALAQRIILPSLPVADEDMTRLSLWETGRSLARQDRWDMLSTMIVSADDARLLTPGGTDEAGLLALGAQSDVSAAAREALEDGQTPSTEGIFALDRIAADARNDHAIALVVALAHINIARAWLDAPTGEHRAASPHEDHLTAAMALLCRFDADELDAPSLAATQAVLAEYMCPDSADVAEAFDRAILLDPHNPAHMRAAGRACRANLAHAPDALDRQARKVMQLTSDIWGKGAYVWLHLDVLAQSKAALMHVDCALFSEGLKDILAIRPDQHIINELAAFCARPVAGEDAEAPAAIKDTHSKLRANLDWILARHLQELHPLIWSRAKRPEAFAPRAAAPRALIAEGRRTALRIIASRFADQLADGSSIAFSPAGMYRLPAM